MLLLSSNYSDFIDFYENIKKNSYYKKQKSLLF